MRPILFSASVFLLVACSGASRVPPDASMQADAGGPADPRRGEEVAQACPLEADRMIIPISQTRSVFTGMDEGVVLVEYNGRCNRLPLRSRTINARIVVENRDCLRPVDAGTVDGVGRLVPSGEPVLGVCGVRSVFRWTGDTPFPGDNGGRE
ncbi:MAG: hypothetical protein AAFV51_10770 [Pseudomonadota bacterium]